MQKRRKQIIYKKKNKLSVKENSHRWTSTENISLRRRVLIIFFKSPRTVLSGNTGNLNDWFLIDFFLKTISSKRVQVQNIWKSQIRCYVSLRYFNKLVYWI